MLIQEIRGILRLQTVCIVCQYFSVACCSLGLCRVPGKHCDVKDLIKLYV